MRLAVSLATLERQVAMASMVERYSPTIRSYEDDIARAMHTASGGLPGRRY